MWIDCEMTGLDLSKDKLIEIAALVTDSELNILGEGVDIVIHADDTWLRWNGSARRVRGAPGRTGYSGTIHASVSDLVSRCGDAAELYGAFASELIL